MGIRKTDWADRFNYKWHSNPSTPDAWTFFDKSVLRPMRDKAWAILRGDIEGDQGWARKVLYDSAYYKDPQGKTQYSDNTNMVSGRAVQVYTDMLLVEDADVTEAYGEAINMLHGYEPPYWHDHDVDKAVLAHRENICYDSEGKKSKEPTMAEFSLVCENAASGIREAMSGANRIVGEIDLYGNIPHCELPYFGKPDYGEGRVELKTQWDQQAHTDSPRANSLPKKIKAPHMTQLAGYWHLSKIVPKIVYANRLGYVVLEPTEQELEHALHDISVACRRREKLMKVADDVVDLLNLTDPHFADSFVWRDLAPEFFMMAKGLFGKR